MARRNWRNVQPIDLRDAMDLCTEYAREKHNRSIDQISDLMGLPSKWTLYKWMQEASLPARSIKNFELACGASFVSRWLVVSSGNKLVIDIPKGRRITDEDILSLQEVINVAINALIKFYRQQDDLTGTIASIQSAMEQLAWHKGNVEKFQQPELPFDEE